MGRLTPEKRKQILEVYSTNFSYSKTAKVCDVDERTVKNVVSEGRVKKALNPPSIVNHTNSNDATGDSEVLEELGISRGELKVMYRDFLDGKIPSQIIAEHGLSPDIVLSQYSIFRRTVESNIYDIDRQLISEFGDRSDSRFTKYEAMINRKGYLTIEETCEFIHRAVEKRIMASMMRLIFDPNTSLPKGLYRLKCLKCNKVFALTTRSDLVNNLIFSDHMALRCESSNIPRISY